MFLDIEKKRLQPKRKKEESYAIGFILLSIGLILITFIYGIFK